MSLRVNHRHFCTFKDGKPVFENPGFFHQDCKSLEGKQGHIVVLPFRKQKTNRQNKYYWGVVVKRLADYWGVTPKEAHEAISNEFLSYRKRPNMPKITKSTALKEWSTVEWENYASHLRRWASQEFGVYIETPDEVDFSTLPDVYY